MSGTSVGASGETAEDMGQDPKHQEIAVMAADARGAPSVDVTAIHVRAFLAGRRARR
jgi:hypothetical protein